ncbi:uncharacterized protein LTR77_008715 [Saxophila tyrrhenica]|uniref:Tyrosinase copper-binding domain-containing protein n=1 Tax=Saxophila tyrrhenica TaxID=1690608 RepID=A0AAV9P0U3_9PEZI|nr:hypothetical protein LTR77_008715 [Saxophila tyrrhenica]
MHLLSGLVAANLALGAAASGFKPASTAGTDKLAKQGLVNLAKYELKNHPPKTCNTKTGYIRKEWSSLKDSEKKEYIDAVLCLQSKPAKSNAAYPAPGARSRYDDFVATHINQTLTIHGTGNFLSWHRYFTWTYEQALRNECGYKGYQPYVNWGRYAEDLYNAPFFDGSATSISNNGAYIKHNGTYVPSAQAPVIYVPPGQGGGCVTKGPFKDMKVNLGPVAPALDFVVANPSTNGLGYNPRCLRRDVSAWAAERASTDKNTTDLITQNDNIEDFQNVMEGGFNQGLELLGVHTAGHFWVAGDPGGDLFASPGDPYFFLHHAQIDRTWWIWQNQDLENRQNAIAGTLTLNNNPPSRNTTLDDIIELGVNAPKGIKIGDAMSTLDGPFCYIYA